MAKHRAAGLQFLEVTGPSSSGPITALIVLLSLCSTRRRVWEPWHWPVVEKTPQTHFFINLSYALCFPTLYYKTSVLYNLFIYSKWHKKGCHFCGEILLLWFLECFISTNELKEGNLVILRYKQNTVNLFSNVYVC